MGQSVYSRRLVKAYSSNLVYYFALFAYCLSCNLDRVLVDGAWGSAIGLVANILKVLAAVFGATHLFRLARGEEGMRVAVVSSAIILSFVIYYFSKSLMLFWLALFVFGARDVELHRIARAFFIAFLISTLIASVMFAFGLALIPAAYRSTGLARMTLGFGHPNQLGFSLMALGIAWICSRFRTPRGVGPAFICFLSIMLLFVAGSRTALLGLLAFALFAIIAGRFELGPRAAKTTVCIVMASAVAMLALSVGVALLYDKDNALIEAMSKLTSGRPYWMNWYLTHYSPTLFGIDFSNAPIMKQGTPEESRLLLDNGYLKLMLRYGYVGFAMVATGIGAVLHGAYREAHLGLCVVGLFTFLVLGLSESFFDPSYNFFLLGMGPVFYGLSLRGFEGETTRAK